MAKPIPLPPVKRILLLSGPVAVGKTAIADVLLKQEGFERLRSGGFLLEFAEKHGLGTDRAGLQELGDRFDVESDYRWIVDDVAGPAVEARPEQLRWLMDAVRKHRQVEHFRSAWGAKAVHLHLTASEELLRRRYEARMASGAEYLGNTSYDAAIAHPNEIESRSLIRIADLVVAVDGLSPEQIVQMAMTRLSP
jgi:adenylosuccinate synthase